jgi:hypothetical protein
MIDLNRATPRPWKRIGKNRIGMQKSVRLLMLALIAATSIATSAAAQSAPASKVWTAVVVSYVAPADAVNWTGPWTVYDGPQEVSHFFATEAECEEQTKKFIATVHAAGIGAPFGYRCISFPKVLP